MERACLVRSRIAVQVLLLTSVIATGAFADQITYKINFALTSGEPTPDSGTFTYDSAAAIGSQFTAFTVEWDGFTFDFTSQANSPTISKTDCGTITSVNIFRMLSGVNQCGGKPDTFTWSAFPSSITTSPVFQISEQGSPVTSFISISATVFSPQPFPDTASGTYTVSPEPSTLILVLTCGAFLVINRIARQPGRSLKMTH